MTVEGKRLDILFRRIAPERLIERLEDFRTRDSRQRREEYQDWFLSAAGGVLDGFSQDEQILLLTQAGQQAQENRTERMPPFHLLAEYGDRVLSLRDGEPVCRFGEVLDWRDTSLCLGQDMIVTAWLARQNARYPFHPLRRFSWPEVLHTDNRILDQILSGNGGISENHCHLYGSAAVFILNWCRLMTWPDLDGESAAWLRERSLQPHVSRGSLDNRMDLKTRLLYAAWIRANLFLRVSGQKVDCFQELLRFHRMLGNSVRKHELCALVDVLRYRFGIRFQQPDGSAVCLDYAFTSALEEDANTDERILSGERYLLYHCFLECFSNGFRQEEQWVFYLYLLLKAGFREEVVQVNRQTGLANFRNYERRKYALWTQPYWNEAYRTAVSVPLHQQPIRSMELRLTPGKSAADDIRLIHQTDKAVCFYEGDFLPVPEELDLMPQAEGTLSARKTFYVLHFVKEADPPPKEHTLSCRHAELRRKIREQALALVRALNQHPWLRRRVRGIDACSQELGCGPEVFAVPFRFLRACPTQLFPGPRWLRGEANLGLTYHVGEDFLDLADGLRSVDEAVCFLNLRRGDRLGHALALGVEPELHYRKKYGSVVLTKQTLLDNLIWLYYRSNELGVTMQPTLQSEIRSRAEDLLAELYRPALGEEREISLRDYYLSWLLRGDAPSLYLGGSFAEGRMGDVFQPFARNVFPLRREILDYCRQNTTAVELYRAYHYSTRLKIDGQAVSRFALTDSYILMMRQMQQAMRRTVSQMGMSVECNPSSNTLIGTFDSYGNHPVLRFNNAALRAEDHTVQMHVSVNTDDQGVFETSLSFEYALIAAAISSARQKDGSPVYSDRQVEDYIRSLQRMGAEQTFPSSVSSNTVNRARDTGAFLQWRNAIHEEQ